MAGSEMRKLVRDLIAQGYHVTMDGGNHWRICDAQDRFLATLPATTANFRWRDNVLTAIRRREREYAEQDAQAAGKAS